MSPTKLKLFYKTEYFYRKEVGVIAYSEPRLFLKFLFSNVSHFMPIFSTEGLGSKTLSRWWQMDKFEQWEDTEIMEFLKLEDPYQAMAYLRKHKKIVVD